MKRSLRRQHVIIFAALLYASPLAAQDDPNLLMNEAISLYTSARSANGEERFQLLQEVDGLLTRIETEFPESAPASLMQMGIPLGPIDQDRLEAELAASEPQLADRLSGQLAEQWRLLQERSPDVAATVERTLKEVSGSVVDEAKEEAYVKTTYIVMSTYYYLGGTALFEYFDAEEAATVYKAFVTGRGLDRALADIGKSTATDIAMGVALDFATSTITDFVIERAPEMKPATQTLVRAGLKATLTEVTLAIQGYKDPTKVPGLGLKRIADLIEIVVTTRGLAADVDRALAETAHRMQTMAQLIASYRNQENVQKIITDTRQNLESELEGAVGKDDAKSVSDIMLLGWAALVAEFEGDTAQAERLHGLLLARGNVDNMPTIWNAPDLAVYFANGFTDSPKRAAEIMIGLTELSKYSRPPEQMEMVTTPSTSPDLAVTQIAPDGFLGPEFGKVLDAAYIQRARDSFLGSFAEMCALPSVQEAGLACPWVASDCDGDGCFTGGPRRALETVQLFAAPGDKRVVATMSAGDWGFTELTRTWLAPCKSVVQEVYDGQTMPSVGTTLWRLHHIGEGFFEYYMPGTGFLQDFSFGTEAQSAAPLERIDPCASQNIEEWALMTTASGQRGWYIPSRQFAGSNSIDIVEPLGDPPEWLEAYREQRKALSNIENAFELVLERPALSPAPPPQGSQEQGARGSVEADSADRPFPPGIGESGVPSRETPSAGGQPVPREFVANNPNALVARVYHLAENGFVAGLPDFRMPRLEDIRSIDASIPSVPVLDRSAALDVLQEVLLGAWYVRPSVGTILELLVAEEDLLAVSEQLEALTRATDTRSEQIAIDRINSLRYLTTYGANRPVSVDRLDLERARFIDDLGFRAILFWRSGQLSSQPGRRGDEVGWIPQMSFGFPLVLNPRLPELDREGILFGLIRAKDVVGIFQTDTTAEVEFTLETEELPADAYRGTGTEPSYEISVDATLARASELGMSTQTIVTFPARDGLARERVDMSDPNRVYTAVFRKYDDGWRFSSVR